MTHARIPDFSQPAPVRRPVHRGTVRLLPAVDRQRAGAVAALHDEDLPGQIEPWQAITPVRPDTAHVRALRIMDVAGELLTGLAIIAGGVLAYGYLPTL